MITLFFAFKISLLLGWKNNDGELRNARNFLENNHDVSRASWGRNVETH